jgi:hypothetical protein
MVIYSKLLASGSISAGRRVTVYTTPSGLTSILKTIYISPWSATPAAVAVLASTSPVSVGYLFYTASASNATPLAMDTWLVVPHGYHLEVENATNSSVSFWLSGSELDGLPPTPEVPTEQDAQLEGAEDVEANLPR